VDSKGAQWKFVLLFAKADEQNRCDNWGLVHYNSAGEVCPDCLADRDEMPFSDLQSSAKWRATEIENNDPFLARMRHPLHPLTSCLFQHRYFFLLDVMHVMDCKGVAASIYGGLIWTLITSPALGPNQAARLKVVNDYMTTWCPCSKCVLPLFEMFDAPVRNVCCPCSKCLMPLFEMFDAPVRNV